MLCNARRRLGNGKRVLLLQRVRGSVRAVSVTAQEGTEILGNNRRKIRKVWKELYYGKTETLEDAEEAARWWRYNIVR